MAANKAALFCLSGRRRREDKEMKIRHEHMKCPAEFAHRCTTTDRDEGGSWTFAYLDSQWAERNTEKLLIETGRSRPRVR